MLGGELSVKSAVGEGSTFSLTLPTEWRETASPRESFEPSSSAGIAPAGSECASRILLVDDNEAAIIQVRQILENEGYGVDVARGGREALDYIKGATPDGVILDLMMPEVDGFEVLNNIRADKITEKIPVLILTAKDLTPGDFGKLKGNNVRQLIQKGEVDREDLLRKTRLMLGVSEETESKEETAPTGPGARKSREKASAEGKPTILVIEDNPDNMITIKAVLHDRCNILGAADGEEGLNMVLTRRPDVILLDISLPGMDGFQVVEKIKADEKTRKTPVIALTARAMKGDREKIIEAGCDDYISKPIDPESVLM
ncbi:MAG: response regulator, partial [Desulfobacterales bacterium]|nr:response regulator [Desulfobacterales bacterium]